MARFYIPSVRTPSFFEPIAPILWRTVKTVVAAYVVLVATAAFPIYRDVENGFTRFAEAVFPYPAAIVNREVISLKRFRQEVAAREFYAAKNNQPAGHQETEAYVMNQLINRILYAQALEKAGIIVTPVDVQNRLDSIYEEAGGEQKLAAFLKENYGDTIGLSDFRTWIAESLYEAAIEHQLLTRITLKHILIALPENPTQAQVDAAQKKAAEVKAKIGSTEQFAEIAKDYSEDVASRDKGGLLGTTTRGSSDLLTQSAELQNGVFNLEPGQISDPLRSSFGWHLFLIDKKEGSVNESLGEYTAELRSTAVLRQYFGN